MEKMRMESKDITAANIEKIGALFPNCMTETIDEYGKIKKAVNFELLKQMLCNDAAEREETYEFTWVGKRAAMIEANKPVRKTLRPCKEESVNWDTTENLYIEGDNLDVLKLLQESYMERVKVIYIDPPYNTGNDFIYRDDFSQSEKEYKGQAGICDEAGRVLFKNTDSNGRFHSEWCSMIYSRLLLARNLLSKDGVIFISIDDHEQENLKKICHEIFGEANFLAQIVWERAYAPVNLKKHFSESHDYILCYAKNHEDTVCNGLPRSKEADGRYINPDHDPRGVWKPGDLSVGPVVESKVYEITTPGGRKVLPPNGYCWRLDRETLEEYIQDNRIWFGPGGNNVPSMKRFLSEVKQGVTPMTIWKYTEVGHSQDATKGLKALFDQKAYFDYPKPVDLIKRCIQLYSDTDCIVMDFFSGSATTAQAVMQLNAEDGGKRRYVLVQLPEKCSERSAAYKDGYRTICDIGRERINRVSEVMKKNADLQKIDWGYRVLKVDESNMKDVYYRASECTQDLLSMLEFNIKEDRTSEDVFFECLLEWGLLLSLPYMEEECDGCRILIYNEGDLVACFDKNISGEAIKHIAKMGPSRAVFMDERFQSSAEKINLLEMFKILSPKTRVKVI
ncbi:MAG: site-specific DNA-methyltransferase [Dorea sp.]|jgi:adenine-specific DNA-methyltransferase|nr:site-specific DNA-methyltransferase [Dorea sp.]